MSVGDELAKGDEEGDGGAGVRSRSVTETGVEKSAQKGWRLSYIYPGQGGPRPRRSVVQEPLLAFTFFFRFWQRSRHGCPSAPTYLPACSCSGGFTADAGRIKASGDTSKACRVSLKFNHPSLSGTVMRRRQRQGPNLLLCIKSFLQ